MFYVQVTSDPQISSWIKIVMNTYTHKMLDFLMEVWSNPKRMTIRKLAKWYRFTSGNFCKCAHDTSMPMDYYTWIFISGWATLYTCFWLYYIWGITEFFYGSVDFSKLCNDPELFSWNLFRRLKYAHKSMLNKYSFNQTKNYGEFLSTFLLGFDKVNDAVMDQNQMFYECATAVGINNFEGLMKAKYCEFIVLTLLYSVGLRMAIKSFVLSFFQNWIPRKHYFYVKLKAIVLDLFIVSGIIHISFSTFDQVLLNFESVIQMII